MLSRIRSLWLAGGGALALTLALSGVVAAGAILTALSAPTVPTTTADPAAFVDLNGNGIDDTCEQDAVVPDPSAAASAEAAVDLNGDGTIAVSEAAQSSRVGGKNCNHGGYVSSVAHGQCDAAAPAASGEPAASSEPEPVASGDEGSNEDSESADCSKDTAETDTPATCDAGAPAASGAPIASSEPVTGDEAPNAHGKLVSGVAQSDAVGGKNCNHGGAVSAAAKKDHDAAKQARALAKAEREAARQAAKDARDAKVHGKKHGG